MRKFYIIGFSLLLIFDTLAQIGFKYTAIHIENIEFGLDWLNSMFSYSWVYIATLCSVLASIVWIFILKKAPVGPSFAASYLEVVTLIFFSHWLFNEVISIQKIIGSIFIISGIIFLAIAESKLLPR